MNDKVNSKQIIKIIAEHLGVEKEDIKKEDSFKDDLHMNPSHFTDLIKAIENSGLDISELDLPEIHSVEELLDALEIED